MSAFPEFGPKAETHQLTIGGVTMRVVVEGDGPPVVFVPGGDQTAEAYSEQFSRLSDSFKCITYDPRGAGDTLSPPPPWTMHDYAADCAAVIDAFAGGQATVCGLSLGGLVTQQTAIDFPGKVRLAIPMGTSAYIDGFTRDWMQAEIDLRKDGITLPDYFLAPHYAVYAFPAKALHEPELWEQLKASYTERFRDRDPQATIDQWEACLEFDCREGLKTCPVPMHVIAFSEDVQTAPVMCKVVSDLAPNGVFHEIPGLGHVSMTRHKPEIVAAKLREILTAELVQQ
ncbi:alpha/beta fold hydrolase [Ruegeria sp. HKCCD4884]|uniref:alpha/beta fold hydrolase n=1 Tax=Ruegeria sp. HKCCD4884 TaxID=2683022 RepID=UPI0014922817|nr:alpha/beta hydrolase [Ruegeria sp. HKCCD4884]NOD92562.1 alpha/beta fold hydrolase [Ruegeria sp. HKCCD4884]